jgi:hypothetical protein
MVDKKTPFQAMPISNSEVLKLIRQQFSHTAAADGGYEMHLFGAEQGSELHKQTLDYCETFNETELDETNNEIRR